MRFPVIKNGAVASRARYIGSTATGKTLPSESC
jgi:hypothetical protein